MIEIMFGDRPNRVTAPGPAPDDHILDLGLSYSSMTLVLKLIALESPGTGPFPVLDVKMETSMDFTGGDWISLGLFTTLVAVDDKDKQNFTGLLRYVRWNVDKYLYAAAMTFTLRGVVR